VVGLLNSSFYVCPLTVPTVFIRFFMAVLLGGIIGLERERKGRPAGFRTYILVALGATMAMVLNQYLDFMLTGPWSELVTSSARTDASRLGAQVINGVGFLGAGTIIVTHRREVKGLTTAAGLWASACMGLSIGAGFFECAIVCVFVIFLCMSAFSKVEYYLMGNARNINIYIEMDRYENLGLVSAGIRAVGIKTFSVDVDPKSAKSRNSFGAVFNLYLSEKENHETVLMRLSGIEGVRSISEV